MLNQKDLMIISHLRSNARASLTDISKKTNIPISTIYDKLKVYEEDLITKHATLIDFTKLGFHAKTTILIKVEHSQKEDIKNYLSNNQNVNSILRINSGYDFLIEAIFKNVKDVETFLDHLQTKFKIEQTQVHYIVDEIKREVFLNNRELAEIAMQ
jgi:Lrp/AsnC family transcriptional regulator, leucine-responsive regulatory protein